MYYGHISTASNRADWDEACQVIDYDTGDPIDISLCRITMTVRKLERNPNYYRDGYYDYAAMPVGVVLTGSTDTGEITLPQLGTFEWLFDYTRMSQLFQGEYEIGIRISQDGRTVQLIVGTVKVIEGIDTQ